MLARLHVERRAPLRETRGDAHAVRGRAVAAELELGAHVLDAQPDAADGAELACVGIVPRAHLTRGVAFEVREHARQDIGHAVCIVNDVRFAFDLDGGVVARGDAPFGRRLLAGVPMARDVGVGADDAEHRARVLGERVERGVGPGQVQQRGALVLHDEVRRHDERPLAGRRADDELAEVVRADEREPFGVVLRRVVRVDEHAPTNAPRAYSRATERARLSPRR